MMANFNVFGSLVRSLYDTLSHVFYLALPVGLYFAVLIGFFKSGSPDYVDLLKRTLVATILLISFPEVSNLILNVCDGLAGKIDSMDGMNAFFKMVAEKSQSYSKTDNTLLLHIDDLIIAVLNYVSFLIVYAARWVMIALYYYYWVLLSVLAPILIFFYIFPATAHLTKNLYVSLIQVASWKIVWAVQSAMITALSLGDNYRAQGSYMTVIVLNFVIALGLLFTPMIANSLAGSGAHSNAQVIGTAAATAIFTSVPKLLKAKTHTREFLTDMNQFVRNRFTNNPPPRR